MPQRNTILRRRWEALVRQALERGMDYRESPRTPVVPWYEWEIDALQRRLSQTSTSVTALQTVAAENNLLDRYTFGVEIECVMPQDFSYRGHARLAAAITEAGVACHFENYNHQTRQAWKVVTDGSIGDYDRGAEIVSPILRGQAGIEQLRTVCRVLNEIGATCRRSCGLHVHVGARDKSVDWFKSVLKTYADCEPVLDTLTAPSRRGNVNVYCGSTRMRIERNQIDSAADIRQLEQIYSQGTRYVKVNLQSYWRHGTVEFRQHHGTINATKIEAWIKIVLSICAVSESPLTVRTVGNLTEMVSKLKLSRDDLAFLQRRQVELSRITSHERV